MFVVCFTLYFFGGGGAAKRFEVDPLTLVDTIARSATRDP